MLKNLMIFFGIGMAAFFGFYSMDAFAETDHSAEYTYEVLNDNAIMITGYTGGGENIIIPSEIDGYVVTQIGYEAFAGYTSLTSVGISDSVTSIDARAFVCCENLASVIIPDNVTAVGHAAFAHCTNLISVDIGSGIKEIGEVTFLNCTSLTSISIPGNVAVIGEQAFRDCTGLESVFIEDGLVEIGKYAFVNCKSLTEIHIPDSVTEICTYGWPAFDGCENLTIYCTPYSGAEEYAAHYDINYINGRRSDSLWDICDEGIVYGVFADDTVSVIGYDGIILLTFPGERTIKSIQHNAVTSIDIYAFYNCARLTSVNIEEGIAEIGDKAFYGCENLTAVIIPDSVVKIGEDVFEECPNLVIYCHSGSYAEKYAYTHSLEYKIQDDKIQDDKKIGKIVIVAIIIAVVVFAVVLFVSVKRKHIRSVRTEESSQEGVVNFCSSCGKRVDAGAAFCKYCGASVSGVKK